MAGWIAEKLFCCSFAYIAVKCTEYEAYWLMGVPIIKACTSHSFFKAVYSNKIKINQPKLLCFQNSKQKSIWKKICNFTVNRDHR